MAAPSDKLQQLDNIERDIGSALQCAGQAIMELSKDKPSQKQVENHTTNFLKTLESVENGLSKNINYLTQVSTGQPHEGSSYAAQKDLQMTLHRLEHVKSRLAELERMKNDHMRMRNVQLPQPMGNAQIPQPIMGNAQMGQQMGGAQMPPQQMGNAQIPQPMGMGEMFTKQEGGMPP